MPLYSALRVPSNAAALPPHQSCPVHGLVNDQDALHLCFLLRCVQLGFHLCQNCILRFPDCPAAHSLQRGCDRLRPDAERWRRRPRPLRCVYADAVAAAGLLPQGQCSPPAALMLTGRLVTSSDAVHPALLDLVPGEVDERAPAIQREPWRCAAALAFMRSQAGIKTAGCSALPHDSPPQ